MLHGAVAVGGVAGVATGLVAVGLWELGAHLVAHDWDTGRAFGRRDSQDVEVRKKNDALARVEDCSVFNLTCVDEPTGRGRGGAGGGRIQPAWSRP